MTTTKYRAVSIAWSTIALSINGCMLGPNNGDVETRPDIANATLAQNGFHITPNVSFNLQILTPATASPDVGDHWQTYAVATSGTQPFNLFASGPLYQWTTGAVSPIQGVASRWTQGGVARVRAIAADRAARIFDTDWLSCPDSFENSLQFAEDCGSYTSYAVLVSSTPTPADNPNPPTGRWLHNNINGPTDPDPSNTQAYYNAIGAGNAGEIATLSLFRSRHGFGTPGDEVSAVYYNNGDLGLGRQMHCRSSGTRRACYVTNFADRDGAGRPIFGGPATLQQDAIAKAITGTDPIATVAMIYDTALVVNPVKFIVYDAFGNTSLTAPLDNHAVQGKSGSSVSVPTNCIACHGGSGAYDALGHVVTDAHFLPFDPYSYTFSATNAAYSLSAQQESFRQLNAYVYEASTAATREFLQAMYTDVQGPIPGTTAAQGTIPSGWTASWNQKELYRHVVGPYCKTCHVSRNDIDALAFRTYDSFKKFDVSVLYDTCIAQLMPHAEQTQRNFWADTARAHILAWTGAAGECTPH